MRLDDIFTARFLKWLLIGAVAALASDIVLSTTETFILSQAQIGQLPATVGVALEIGLAVILTVLALVIVGERSWPTLVAASVGSGVGYLIGAAHLAALSIGVSVITLGERLERGRAPIGSRAASRAPAPPRVSRASSRHRRSRRR